MSSIEQHTRVDQTGPPATRLTRRRRRGPLAAALGLVVLLTACGVFPTGTHTIAGTVWEGSHQALTADDDQYLSTAASCNGFFGGCVTDWYASFGAAIVDEGQRYRVLYVGKNWGAAYQFIYVWNWRTSSWFAIDEWRVVLNQNVTVDKTLPGPNTDWVSPQGHAFLRVLTVGNFTDSHAGFLSGRTEPA